MTSPPIEWRPNLAVFVRRCLWVGGGTLVVFGGFGIVTGFWQILFAAPVLLAAYTFLFDDHLKWLDIRHDRWELTASTLVHHGFEGEAHVPLAEITGATTRFGWAVIVTLTSGLRIEIPYVRNPSDIAAQIIAARDRITGTLRD